MVSLLLSEIHLQLEFLNVRKLSRPKDFGEWIEVRSPEEINLMIAPAL